jgi:hypothetical protein
MGKMFLQLSLLLIVFVAGYLASSWRFVYSGIYTLNEPVTIESGAELGVLPKGTELHYQSRAHGDVDFYVFVRMPHEKAMEKTTKIEADTYNGIKRLKGSFE